jgi:uncharacterized protein with HEPN domain
MPPKSVRANLLELKQSATYLQDRTNGLSFDEIEGDFELVLVVERLLERIGETIRRLSLQDFELAARIPDHRQAIDMRNILAHAYYHVNWDRVRQTLDESIPSMLTAVQEIDRTMER